MLRPYETACESRMGKNHRALAIGRRAAAKVRRAANLALESLETRRLLSASISSSGVLDVTADSSSNTIIVSLLHGGSNMIKVTDNGLTQIFSTSGITQIDVTGGSGTNLLELKEQNGGINIPALITGNGTADTLIGGSGADTLVCGSGNDSVVAGSGANVLEGGSGKDTLVGGNGDDVLNGGTGKSKIIGGSGSDTVVSNASDTLKLNNAVGDLVSKNNGASFSVTGAPASTGIPSSIGNAEIHASTDIISSTAGPASSIIPALVGPQQLRTYYDFPSLGASTTTDLGQGQTIAIILPGYDPTAFSDLTTFSEEYNLPLPILGQTFLPVIVGNKNPPVLADGTEEDSLDIEYSHAMAPDARIILIETQFQNVITQPPNGGALRAIDFEFSTNDFAQALETAGTMLTDSPGGGGVVSMSFGVSELATVTNTVSAAELDPVLQDATFEYALDKVFAKFPNVSFIAASGDAAGELNYPAMSPYVTGVGGTQVTLEGDGNAVGAETVWPYSGGGISLVEAEPLYQQEFLGPTEDIPDAADLVPPATNDSSLTQARVGPDVAFLSAPTLEGGQEGVAIYDNSANDGFNGWLGVIGTSLATPMFAATVALGNEVRAAAGEPVIGENLNNAIYYMNAEFGTRDFTELATGGAGFDPALQTGWGTPIVPAFINDLATLAPPSFTPPTLSIDVDDVALHVQATEYYGTNDPTSSLNLPPDAFPGASNTLIEFPGQTNEIFISQSGIGEAFTIGPNTIALSLGGFDSNDLPMLTGLFANPLDPLNTFDVGDFNVNPITGEFSGVAYVAVDGTAGVVDEAPNVSTDQAPFGSGLYVQGTVNASGTAISGSFYTVVFNADGSYRKLGIADSSSLLPDLEGTFGTS
jgi:hypothetical protein